MTSAPGFELRTGLDWRDPVTALRELEGLHRDVHESWDLMGETVTPADPHHKEEL